MAALVLLAPGAAASADAVVLVEVGDERPHVREFVEHHLAVGFARVYAVLSVEANESRRHLSVDEVNATLQSYPRDVVRVVPRSGQHNQQHVHHGTALLISRAVRDAGGAPLWICAIDADEYVTPVDPWQRVPSLLAMYEAAGQLHIGVEKLWFGGAHDPELERCVGASADEVTLAAVAAGEVVGRESIRDACALRIQLVSHVKQPLRRVKQCKPAPHTVHT